MANKSKINDIYRNLSIEESLFHSSLLPLPALFLWQSQDAVVIGKHQNPWMECLVDELKQKSIPIVRRISGGGTVFHDMGNLNFTIIQEENKYSSKRVYSAIFKALKRYNITAKVEKKSNLCIDGKKFSGNAFAYRKKRVLHHGTLLVNADLDKLRYFLRPQYDTIETRAIASIPASVVNLNDLKPEVTIESLSTAIKESFSSLFKGIIIERTDLIDKLESIESLDSIEKRLRSDKWIFGKTPDFTLKINGKEYFIKNGNFK